MSLRVCTSLLVALTPMMAFVGSASAQEARLGSTRWALPGVVRVPAATIEPSRVGVALDGGYALTESQDSEGVHHRVQASAGFGVIPTRWAQLGVLGTMRYDRHPSDSKGVDTGTLGQWSAVARYYPCIGQQWCVGADIGVTFPGSEKPLDSLQSPAIDARGLLGWTLSKAIRLNSFLGFRLDKTSGVGQNAAYYRTGDRLALGLSDYDAILVGAAAMVSVGSVELVGEASADCLVGNGAPPISQSPIRVDLGVRHFASDRVQLELLAEISPSARPRISPDAPLIPVEPRFGLLFGIRYGLWTRATAPTVIARSREAAIAVAPPTRVEPTPPVAAPTKVRVVVTVFDKDGQPLSDATVLLKTNTGEVALDFESGATFSTDSAPIGRSQLIVRAPLMKDWEESLVIEANAPGTAERRVEMVPVEKSGQIRGLVRGFDGKGLHAQARIEPSGPDLEVGADGTFSMDVVPGTYTVKVWLDGYATQIRTVVVGKLGVTVLNVDLQRERR